MAPSGKQHTGNCPVAFALDLLGDRWSLLIIRDMLLKESKTYGDFLGSGEGIATNVLANRLKDLEDAGVITRKQDPDNRRSYLYSLTEKGFDLAPIILEMFRWSAHHGHKAAARSKLLQRFEKDPDQLLAELRQKVLTG